MFCNTLMLRFKGNQKISAIVALRASVSSMSLKLAKELIEDGWFVVSGDQYRAIYLEYTRKLLRQNREDEVSNDWETCATIPPIASITYMGVTEDK